MAPIRDDRGFVRANADQEPQVKRIVVFGWKLNFNKIGFTKFLRSEFNSSLSEAKGMTDNLLEGRTITFEISEDDSSRIVKDLDKLLADFRVEEAE
jgi:ribosomal protein L7/L12